MSVERLSTPLSEPVIWLRVKRIAHRSTEGPFLVDWWLSMMPAPGFCPTFAGVVEDAGKPRERPFVVMLLLPSTSGLVFSLAFRSLVKGELD